MILLKVLQAKAKLKERRIGKRTRLLFDLCTATTVIVQIAEMCASLSVGSVGGGPFAAVELILISIYSFLSTSPLIFLRDQQKATIEVMISNRKEAFQHAVTGDGTDFFLESSFNEIVEFYSAVFKKLVLKLNTLIVTAAAIAIVSFVLSMV